MRRSVCSSLRLLCGCLWKSGLSVCYEANDCTDCTGFQESFLSQVGFRQGLAGQFHTPTNFFSFRFAGSSLNTGGEVGALYVCMWFWDRWCVLSYVCHSFCAFGVLFLVYHLIVLFRWCFFAGDLFGDLSLSSAMDHLGRQSWVCIHTLRLHLEGAPGGSGGNSGYRKRTKAYSDPLQVHL